MLTLLVTEVQPDTANLQALKFGMPPIIVNTTIDQAHSPHYAIGYMFNKIQPRLAMVTHLSYDEELIPEIVAGIRLHYRGLFHFGAPDVVVVNVTKDAVWTRKATIPEAGNMARPSQRRRRPVRFEPDESAGQVPESPACGRRHAGAGRARSRDRPEGVHYPSDMYREPQRNFPSGYKIDISQVVQKKLRATQAKLTGEQQKLQQIIDKLEGQ